MHRNTIEKITYDAFATEYCAAAEDIEKFFFPFLVNA